MTTDPASAVPPSKFAEGQKLANCYLLKRRLSEASDAVVWSAQDDVLGKEVSLHFLPTSVLRDKIAMNALRQEVKRNRALIHPNILRVYDLIEEADWAAVSMDTFEGRSLATLLKEKGKLDPAEIQPWLGPLCQTLEEAHKISLVHRDLAPENVFVGGAKQFFLSHFGLSRVVQDALHRTEKKGGDSSRMSTLSPQLLDAQTPARTDDVYGVGTLLFHLLTGAPVFAKGDAIPQIRNAVPPRVSEVRAAQDKEAAPLPAGWDETIAACLHKSPENRPPTPAQLAAKLATATVLAQPEPTQKKPAGILAERAAQFKAGEAAVTPPEAVAPAKKKPAEILAERAAQFKAGEVSAPAREAAAPVPPKKKAAELLAQRAAQFKAEGGASAPPKPPEKGGNGGGAKTEKNVEKPKSSPGGGGADLFLPLRQSRSPVGAVAVAALLVVGGAAFYYHRVTDKPSAIPPQIATTDVGDNEELTSVKNSLPEPLAAGESISSPGETSAVPPTIASGDVEVPASAAKLPTAPSLQPVPATPVVIVAENAVAKRATPAPAPAAAAVAPADSKELAEKAAALEKLKQDAAAADKAHQDKVKQQQAAEAAVSEAQKAITEKSKAAGPVKKAAEDLLAARKKREDEQKTAEAAALAAQQLAAEKAKAAEEAKKALADFDTQNKDKLAAQKQAETELQTMQQTLADRQKAAADAATAVAEADTSRLQQVAAMRQTEQELTQARLAAEKAAAEAEKRRAAMEGERRRLDEELAAMRAMFEQKMKEIEERRRQLEGGAVPPEPAPSRTEKPAMPPGAEAKPAATPAMTLALKTESEKPLAPKPTAAEAEGEAFENSLGLKFVPVGDVAFSVWQTRVKDFEDFAKSVNLKSKDWRSPGFRQGPDHPVVNVTWNEAIAFCKWLTEKERKEGKLSANQFYRLPYDLEWSSAVGLAPESGKTPEARDMGVPDVYPWGTDWPPPKGAGNYTGEETGSDVAIKGYNDQFPWTAPVGSFPPNKYGLYDMGGNVWQWCMDSWNSDSKAKVLRGASWYNGALKLSLLASCRVHHAPDSGTDNYGFRIVRATDSGNRAARRP